MRTSIASGSSSGITPHIPLLDIQENVASAEGGEYENCNNFLSRLAGAIPASLASVLIGVAPTPTHQIELPKPVINSAYGSISPTDNWERTKYTPGSDLVETLQELLDRLDEIGGLAAGWMNGAGEPVAKPPSDFIRKGAARLASLGQPRVRIYPTEEGGLQLERDVPGRSISVEISEDLSAFAISYDVTTGASTEVDLPQISLEELIQLLRGKFGE
ncbi:hypothetical protein AB0K60_01625 [Thermopolyspora sp. NPDC052614]|uniref:hypothetical protein n=1 Tax=Thermopolyspora sp. NPDC052614 TaxID=3155682 RepID=UPI00343A6E93